MLFLAGLITSAEASRRCGLDEDEFRSLLAGLKLDGAAFVPARLDSDRAVSFLALGRESFGDPTFDESIDRSLADGAGPRAFRLPAAAIVDCPLADEPPPFKAVILHVGRAGSTLLCNLLAAGFGLVSAREPEFVNSLLLDVAANGNSNGLELLARLLRSLGHGLRGPQNGQAFTSILKLSSWNALFAGQIFPLLGNVPIIVVTREPEDTVASLLHSPPWWHAAVVRGRTKTPEEQVRFLAQTWAGIVDQALALPEERTLFIDYSEVVTDPMSVLEAISTHLGRTSFPIRRDVIQPVMLQYSKSTSPEPFDSKVRHFRPVLPPALRPVVETIAGDTRLTLVERSTASLKIRSCAV